MKQPTQVLIVVLAGCLFSVLVFLPLDELTSYYEYHYQANYSVGQFVGRQLAKALLF